MEKSSKQLSLNKNNADLAQDRLTFEAPDYSAVLTPQLRQNPESRGLSAFVTFKHRWNISGRSLVYGSDIRLNIPF